MTDAAILSPELLARRKYTPGTDWRNKVPRALSWAMYLTAAYCLVISFLPPLRSKALGVHDFVETVFISAPPNIGWAVALIIVGSALGKRKRLAWRFALVILAYEVVKSLFTIVTLSESAAAAAAKLAIDLALIALLVASNQEFYAIVQRGNAPRALLTFVVGGLIALTVSWVIVRIWHGDLTPQDQLPYVANQLLGGLGTTEQTGIAERPPRLIANLIGALGAVVYVLTAWVLFRSRRLQTLISQQDEVRVRGLIDEYAQDDSLAYFATRRDKAAMYSSAGNAVITYRLEKGTSVASADPIGDPREWGDAIENWLEEARHFGWAAAAIGASEVGAQAYVKAGLSAMELGDEAILSFREFSLEGREMRAVRQAVNRVERAGYTARVRRHRDVPEADMAAAIAAADTWRDTKEERGFSMALGRLGDPADEECVLVEALDSSGRLVSLLNFSPWGAKGLSLDLMRRSPEAENGVMEFMVVRLVESGTAIGAERLSLNFALLRAVFAEAERIGAGPVIRLTRGLLMFASRWWQLESLYRANQKYDPDWVPRYLMFQNPGDLPRVVLAMAEVEGFVDLPSPGQWFRAASAESPLVRGAQGSPMAMLELERAKRESAQEQARAEAAANPYADLPDQERVRRQKLAAMRARGVDPYSASWERTDDAAGVRARHQSVQGEPNVRTGDRVSLAGRVMLNRSHGGLCFANLRDWSGDIQILLDGKRHELLAEWKSDVDLGDHVGVAGEVITSGTGELTVDVDSFAMTSKCLVPLPDKRRGLADPEARVRQRYVDLIVNRESRDMLALRAEAVRGIREFLWERAYLEVETPMLQRIHGGANARPFTTHINAYDLRLYMRIAPELYLKRLLVGGTERVFELNRNFRNEGADATHNPEFTSLEMYDSYGDYDTMRELTRELILHVATRVHGEPVVIRRTPDGNAERIDISHDWPVVTLHEGISAALGEEITPATEAHVLRRFSERAGIALKPSWDADHIALELYEHLCEDRTTSPVFYTDFPTSVSPLTRQKPGSPLVAERWDLVAWGAEIGTAYTELIDPIDQRERLTAQSMLAAEGDVEAMELDEDFLRALEYGMPPAGGQGMGIDRLVMLLTGHNIRETLLFPLVRPGE